MALDVSLSLLGQGQVSPVGVEAAWMDLLLGVVPKEKGERIVAQVLGGRTWAAPVRLRGCGRVYYNLEIGRAR